MNLTLLATYNLSIVTLLLTPGSVVALITTTASQHGYRQAFIVLIGTNGASSVLIALAVLILAGVVPISTIWPGILDPVGSLYTGVTAINGLWARDLNPGLCAPKRDSDGPIHGFLTGVVNPKDILFFVAFFSQFIAITQDFTTSTVTLTLVRVIFNVTVLFFYVVVFGRWIPERFARRSVFIFSLLLLAVVAFGIIYNVRML